MSFESWTIEELFARCTDYDDGSLNMDKEEFAALRRMLQDKADGKPELTVWYGPMPESIGKTNWTAMLHRKGQHPWEGITIDCSEYPDRTLYEADRMRHLIGELTDEPDILAYDADKHSGYVAPGKADGNSPVIPDGWKLVPVNATRAMIAAAARVEEGGYDAMHKAMLAAAPQKEADNA